MEHTNVMPRSNQRKLSYIFRGLMVLLFIYGCFLPENWREAFGVLARPIAFAAEYVPAIHKAVGTAQAVRPELGYGFLGMAAYIPLIFALCFAWYGFFDRSDPNEVRLIVGIRGAVRIFGKVGKTHEANWGIFYSGSRLRLACFNSHNELGVKDKIVYFGGLLFVIIGTYIYPFGDWLNARAAKGKPFCQFVGEPTLDSILAVLFGVMWTGLMCLGFVNIIALLVDMLIDSKQ